jgi:hypothetical protein
MLVSQVARITWVSHWHRTSLNVLEWGFAHIDIICRINYKKERLLREKNGLGSITIVPREGWLIMVCEKSRRKWVISRLKTGVKTRVDCLLTFRHPKGFHNKNREERTD